MKQFAFYFDSQSCTGCKACQVACKDKHSLPLGALWRRVYEVTGGGWTARGPAWLSDVFAYNLSISCNHCEQPACRDACPSGAIWKRADGIVLIDENKCLGCGYCAWACPYGAPQYDEARGVMTKCTFCADEIDQGKPPACVAACPLRILDFGEKTELEEKHSLRGTAYPLPDERLTRPALVFKPHPSASRAIQCKAAVSNREEM